MTSLQEVPPNSNTNVINLADLNTRKQAIAIHHTDEPIDSENVHHCLCPRSVRTAIEISVPNTVDETYMINTVIPESTKELTPNSCNIILKIECVSCSKDPTYKIYKTTMMTIPNQVLDGLRSNNIKQCVFYVGFSKDKRKFPILNKKPYDKDLAKFNYNDDSIPYQSEIITI